MDFRNTKNSIVSGALSGAITAFAFQPFECIKTKLQQPGRPANQKLLSVIHGVLKETETGPVHLARIRLLWNGLTPSLYRTIPVATIYFGTLDVLRNSSYFKQSSYSQATKSFIVGSLSRALSDLLTFPITMVKTRFESDHYNYKSVFYALKSVWRKEGVRGLYAGLNATLVRDISYSGFYLLFYDQIKMYIIQRSNDGQLIHNKDSLLYFSACALSSGVLASAITQPSDVVRTFIQIDPTRSYAHTVKRIYHTYGFKGFYVGFIPRTARRTLISTISWTLYEKFSIKI